MGISPAEKNMIGLLKALGLDMEMTVGIVCFLNTKERMMAMERFFLERGKENPPTRQEILNELGRIVKADQAGIL